MAKIGIIGGSGLEDPEILKGGMDISVDTPYGKPSSELTSGKIDDVDVVLLARHGKNHQISPSLVNYRANIHALKSIGCSHIVTTTAVGSLREEIGRGDLAILDQFIDFTRHRNFSFFESFEPGNPRHAPMAEPFSRELRGLLIDGCRELGFRFHETATVITIEGLHARSYQIGDSEAMIVGQRGLIKLQTLPHSPTGFAVEAGFLDEREALHHAERHLVSNFLAFQI